MEQKNMVFKAPKEAKKNIYEEYTGWWFNELKQNGYIKQIIFQPYAIEVTPKIVYKKNVLSKTQKKTVKEETFTISNANFYTPDWLIIWDEKAKEIFFNVLDGITPVRTFCLFYAQLNDNGEYYSLCDTKPPSMGMKFNNSTSYTFPIIKKILLHTKGIWINKTIPIPMVSKGEIKSGNKNSLFASTFVPKRYIMTDGGKQARVISYKTKTLAEFVASQLQIIKNFNDAENNFSQGTLL